ncbi:serine/threonine protein kinase [Cylindrospermum sp. NIES-4074]|nr:serine/threonine protein kinase [Cylindrospermum sp. NIES-4074]
MGEPLRCSGFQSCSKWRWASSPPSLLDGRDAHPTRLDNLFVGVPLEKLGDHNQIPRPLAYFEEDAEFYLVQDFIEGHALSSEILSGERWTESQVIELLRTYAFIMKKRRRGAVN